MNLFLRIFILFITVSLSAADKCYLLFVDQLPDVAPKTRLSQNETKILGLRIQEFEPMYQQLKRSVFNKDHIGQNVVINKSLEQMYLKLQSEKFKDIDKDNRRTQLLDKITELMTKKNMNFSNYLEISLDFLILAGELMPLEIAELHKEVNLERIKKVLSQTGLLLLPVHINDGVLALSELNMLWGHRILPMGIATKPQPADGYVRSPFIFFMHDFAHARQRFSRLFNTMESLEATTAYTETTRIMVTRFNYIIAEHPEYAMLLNEILFAHLHESGTNELHSLQDALTRYYLPAFSGLIADQKFIDQLIGGPHSNKARAQVKVAARKMIKDLYRKYDFFDDFYLQKISEAELTELIIFILKLENPK